MKTPAAQGGMREAPVDGMLASGENQTVEFKKLDILSDKVKLASEMVALANTNGGWILIGVHDDGTLEGMKFKKEHEAHIMNIARDVCDPPILPVFSIISRPQGDIYLIGIPRYATIPHSVKTREGRVYFIRAGSTVREAAPTELSVMFATQGTPTKRPVLELNLVDSNENAAKEIRMEPMMTRIRTIKVERPTDPSAQAMWDMSRQTQEATRALLKATVLPSILPGVPPDFVPIGIELSNQGEAPATGVRVFMNFPPDCELTSEPIAQLLLTSNKGQGMSVDPESHEAVAWVDSLGNDLSTRGFGEIYVKFGEEEKDYVVKARVVQNNYPPEDFVFRIHVKPKIEEIEEYVYEE
jgi:hypothetical protein